MTALIYSLMTLCLFGVSAWLFTLRSELAAPARGAVTASIVALLLAGIAALLTALIATGLNSEALKDGQRLFGLAARHLSLPVLGLATCFLTQGWSWKPMVWGQIILGLMGAFELARLLDVSPRYEWLVNGLGLLLLVWASLVASRNRLMLIMGAAALGCLVAAALISGSTPLVALFRPGPTASWLIPGLTACALAVGVSADQAHNKPQTPDQRPG